MENLEAKGTQATHLSVAEPLKAAIPTQDTEDWLPLGWLAPKLSQVSLVLSDSGQLLWEKWPSEGHGLVFQCPDHLDSSHCIPGATKYKVLRHCYVALLYQAHLKHALVCGPSKYKLM